jgi:glycosyltransferase involved in cell wall biosynthesis
MGANDLRNSPILSAIVPVTKMSGRLKNLDSWLGLVELLPVEIIIVHDIQDTKTSAELLNLVKKYKNLDITIHEGKFGSPGGARNAGIAFAQGQWTAFWDSDDLPSVVEIVNCINLANLEIEIIIGDFEIHQDSESKRKLHHQNLNLVALNPGLWRMVFRNKITTKAEFEEFLMGEDQLFVASMNLNSRKIMFSRSIFYKYFKGSPHQLTSNRVALSENELALQKLTQLVLAESKYQNMVSEIIRVRLFLNLVKQNKKILLNPISLYRQKSKYMISIKKLFLVSGLLTTSKLLELFPKRYFDEGQLNSSSSSHNRSTESFKKTDKRLRHKRPK